MSVFTKKVGFINDLLLKIFKNIFCHMLVFDQLTFASLPLKLEDRPLQQKRACGV